MRVRVTPPTALENSFNALRLWIMIEKIALLRYKYRILSLQKPLVFLGDLLSGNFVEERV